MSSDQCYGKKSRGRGEGAHPTFPLCFTPAAPPLLNPKGFLFFLSFSFFWAACFGSWVCLTGPGGGEWAYRGVRMFLEMSYPVMIASITPSDSPMAHSHRLGQSSCSTWVLRFCLSMDSLCLAVNFNTERAVFPTGNLSKQRQRWSGDQGNG